MKTLTKTITKVKKYQLYDAGKYKVLKAEQETAVSGKDVPSNAYWVIPAGRCNTDDPDVLIKRALKSGPRDHLVPVQVVSKEYLDAYKDGHGTGDAEWPVINEVVDYLSGQYKSQAGTLDDRLVAPLDWYDGFIYDINRVPVRCAIRLDYITSLHFVNPNGSNDRVVFDTPEQLAARLKKLPSIIKNLTMCVIPIYNREDCGFDEGVDCYIHLSAKGWAKYIEIYRKKGPLEALLDTVKLILTGKLR